MNIRFILYSSLVFGLLILLGACKMSRIQQNRTSDNELLVSQIWKDQFGNHYLIGEDQAFMKFDPQGEQLHTFVHESFYGISKVDLTDPYKIALFYRDQQKIILLDKTLSYMGEIDLGELEERYIRSICNSGEGSYWLYDENKQQLLEIDKDLNLLTESYPLYQEGLKVFPALDIQKNHKKIVLASTNGDILLFDHLGSYQRSLKSLPFAHFELLDNMLLLIQGNAFYLYDFVNFETIPVFEEIRENVRAFAIDQQKREILLYDSMDPIRAIKPKNLP